MNQETPAILPPTYKEMLVEAGRQIWSRRSLILKRSLLVTWPIFILVIFQEIALIQTKSYALLNYFSIFWTLFTVCYVLVLRGIFSIEKTIWLDSYFDGKNLDGKESFRIARRLFLPMMGVWLKLIPKFGKVLGAFLLAFTLESAALMFVVTSDRGLKTIFGIPTAAYAILATAAFLILFAAAIYFLIVFALKIRYLTFLFLDFYTPGKIDWQEFWKQLEMLNQVSKTEAVKKTLVAYLGSASANAIAQSAAADLEYGIHQSASYVKIFLASRILRVIGSILRVFVGEVSYHVFSFGQGAALYLLYRHTREAAFGKAQKVNENIYKLASPQGFGLV